METIFTFGIILLFIYFWQTFIHPSSHQLLIQIWGLHKIPKLLLELAGVDKKGNITWQSLDKSEEKKVMKYYKKLEDVVSVRLTFLYSQNLVHIQRHNGGYFFPLDQEDNELIRGEIGKLSEKIYIEFVLYRRKRSWLRSPILIGYLIKHDKYALMNKEVKETEILSEFPEELIKRKFLTGGLQNKFRLKEDVIADYYTNDLGDSQGIYHVAYDQEHHSGCNFRFQIH